MATRLTTTHGAWRSLLAAVVALALLLALGATSAAAASPTACRVRNTDTGETYTALQAAVDAATKGDRLVVRGICRGTTVIDRDLVIVGIRTEDSGKPTLSGGQAENKSGGSRPPPGSDLRDYEDKRGRKARVLEIEQGVRVTLRDLVITRGLAVRGAGIRNRGDLTLRDVQVRRNSSDPDEWYDWGPGVYNEGRLRLNGATRIVRNHYGASSWGEVFNRDTLVMNGSSSIGSLGMGSHATLMMNGASSVGEYSGGHLINAGRVTMNDASWIRPFGRGVYDSWDYCCGVRNSGTFTMNDASSIRDGRMEARAVYNTGTFTMNDASSISGNPGGGLVNMRGIVRMNDESSMRDNASYCSGGGVAMYGGRLRMAGASSITANTVIDQGLPQDEYRCDTGVRGGGIFGAGTLVGVTCGPGGNVYGNTPDDCYLEP